MPWLEGNTHLFKKHLSLNPLLASHSVRDSLISQSWSCSQLPDLGLPELLWTQSTLSPTLCKLFYLDSILMALVAGTKSKPIWFLGYEFVGFFFFTYSLIIDWIYNSCRLKLNCCTVVHFYHCSNIYKTTIQSNVSFKTGDYFGEFSTFVVRITSTEVRYEYIAALCHCY